MELSGGSPVTLVDAGNLAVLTGDRPRADELFGRLVRISETGFVPPTFLARAHLVRGEVDAALLRFQVALDGHDPWVGSHRLYAGIFPSAPRVEELLAPHLP